MRIYNPLCTWPSPNTNTYLILFMCFLYFSYQQRFWRRPVFDGVDLIRKALDDSYGVNKVSLVSAAFRWLNHHSLLSPDHGGTSCGWTSEMHDKCVH